MERILGVSEHFNIPTVVCINKYDINERNAERIEDRCREKGVEVVGKLPYDDAATKAMIEKKSVIEFTDGGLSREISWIWRRIMKILNPVSVQ